jgi:hypothetical protein
MLKRAFSAMFLAPMLLLAIFMYIVGERKVESMREPREQTKKKE